MSMTTGYADPTKGMASDPFTPLKSQILAGLNAGGKSIIAPPLDGGRLPDSAVVASQLLGSLSVALSQQPALIDKVQATARKAYMVPAVKDPTMLADKAWWNDVLSLVQQAAPVVMSLVSGGGKDFNAVASSPEAQRHQDDKDWQNFVADLATQVMPMLVQALRGTKDFSQPGAVTLNIQLPANKPKGWFDDAVSAVTRIVPIVLPYVIAAI
jgi:hypothetical protein